MKFIINKAVGTLMERMTTNKRATLVSVEDFHKSIVKGEYLTIVSEILAAKAEGTMTKVVVKGNEQMVSLAEHLKKQLPYYVPQADVRKRRLWEHATDFTGFAPIDCDHLTKEQVDNLMDWAKAQPWVIEGHRSSSGKGVHLIVAMGVVDETDKKRYECEYKRRYAIISDHIRQQTGIEVDGQCKDVLRGFFVSYDPNAFLRPVEEVRCFEYPDKPESEDTPEEARKGIRQHRKYQVTPSGDTSGAAASGIDKKILTSFLKYNIYKPNKRHSWWTALGQRLRYKGVPQEMIPDYREAARGLLMFEGLLLPDDPLLRSATEVDEAMAWGYEHSEDGSDNGEPQKKKRGRPRKTDSDDGGEKPVVMEQIHEKLDSMAEFRRNTLTENVEVRELDGNGEWKGMDDTLFCTFYDRIKRAGIRTNKTDVEVAIHSRDSTPEYNPVMDYLDSCHAWDPTQPDYIDELFGHLIFEDETEKAYAMPLLRKWFVSMVALWLDKTDSNQMMPVLYGEQRLGKSHFYRHLLPPELRQYYKEIHPSDPLDKDQRIAMSRLLLIAFEEFSFSDRNSSNQIKAYVSSTASNDRAAYGHFQILRKRKASLIASTNDNIIIRDRNGNRRYLCLAITRTKHIGNDTLPYHGAYAQARWMVENCDSSEYTPTKAEADAISEHNERYMERSQCELMLELFYRVPEPDEVGEMVTMGTIMDKLTANRVPNINHSNVGNALKRQGIKKRRTSTGVRYYVMEVKPYQIEEENKKLGQEEHDKEIEEADKRRQAGEDIAF